MSGDVRSRRRAAKRVLWLSAILLGALVAATLFYRVPDWTLPAVFVGAFLLGAVAAGRVFHVAVAAVNTQVAKRAIGGGHPLPPAAVRGRAGVGYGHRADLHAAPPAANTTSEDEATR